MKKISLHPLSMVFFMINNYTPLNTSYIVKHVPHTKYNNNPFTKDTIIIWVHGTKFIETSIFKKLFHKKAQLKSAYELADNHYYKRIIDSFSSHSSIDMNNFYFFGWSGALSDKKRCNAGFSLYQEVFALQKKYEAASNVSPTIIMIGHSHGGNVILNMHQNYQKNHNVLIDKVILLACPAQEIMYQSLSSPLFKKLFSLYSCRDIIQILAPNFFKSKPFNLKSITSNPFSKRMFPLQDNLVQCRVIMNGLGPQHNDFTKKPFLATLPSILTHMDSWQKNSQNKKYLAYISTQKKRRRSH